MEQKFIINFMYDREKYQIVIDYFVYILNNNFLLALTYFSQNTGYSYDYTGINFAYDEESKKLIVLFYDFDYEIYIDVTVFINVLKLASEVYIEYNPNYKEEVFKLFEQTCKNLISVRWGIYEKNW